MYETLHNRYKIANIFRVNFKNEKKTFDVHNFKLSLCLEIPFKTDITVKKDIIFVFETLLLFFSYINIKNYSNLLQVLFFSFALISLQNVQYKIIVCALTRLLHYFFSAQKPCNFLKSSKNELLPIDWFQ